MKLTDLRFGCVVDHLRVDGFRMELHPFNSFNAKILPQVDGGNQGTVVGACLPKSRVDPFLFDPLSFPKFLVKFRLSEEVSL